MVNLQIERMLQDIDVSTMSLAGFLNLRMTVRKKTLLPRSHGMSASTAFLSQGTLQNITNQRNKTFCFI